jgi:hypothetical protein
VQKLFQQARHSQVGGGALTRWPPSAAQTARTHFGECYANTNLLEWDFGLVWSDSHRRVPRLSPLEYNALPAYLLPGL